MTMMVNVLTDNYPSETSWMIVNTCPGQTELSVERNALYAVPNTSYSDDYCIPEAAYTLTISNSYGDSICCGYMARSRMWSRMAGCKLPGFAVSEFREYHFWISCRTVSHGEPQ